MNATANLRAKLVLFVVLHSSFVIPALAGTSASYTITPDTLDSGGLRGTSALYTIDFSSTPGGAGASATYTTRTGYAGQLSEAIAAAIAIGIDITASPLTVNEGSTRQLSVTLLYDDLTTSPLSASSITWSVQSGPLTGISSSGLVTAANVYQDTLATVHGAYLTFTDTLNLTVLNTNPDNFGTYAADGITDDWQIQYFGQPPNANAAPASDPDFDGQDNLFEFTAGVIPSNPQSRFLIDAASVPGQPLHKNVLFSPRFSDRTYTVQLSTTLINGSWTSLSGATISDNGSQRTVTDPNATGPRKFYRVQITKP